MTREERKAEAQRLYDAGNSKRAVADFMGLPHSTVGHLLKGCMRKKVVVRDFQEFDGVKYYRTDGGWYRSSKPMQKYLHRVIWEKKNGPIPKGKHVHHKDHDQSNNPEDCSNYELLSDWEHQQHHMKERYANARKDEGDNGGGNTGGPDQESGTGSEPDSDAAKA